MVNSIVCRDEMGNFSANNIICNEIIINKPTISSDKNIFAPENLRNFDSIYTLSYDGSTGEIGYKTDIVDNMDIRTKTNIKDIDINNIFNLINRIECKSFNNMDKSHSMFKYGVIANQLQKKMNLNILLNLNMDILEIFIKLIL
jgi:hypothetical protein